MKIKTKELSGIRQRDIEIRTADVVGRKVDRAERIEIENALKHQLSSSDRRKWDRMATHEKEKIIREAIKDRRGGSEKASSFLRYEEIRGGVRSSQNTQSSGKNTRGSAPNDGIKNAPDGNIGSAGNAGNIGGGAISSVREGGTSGAGSVGSGIAENTVRAGAEVTKDAAATAASAGTHAAVKAVKKSLDVAKSVKQKMEPRDYEAQNKRMGYGQPMEQNANGTSGSRKMVDKVKPLIAAASISVMPIVAAMATTIAILFLIISPILGFGEYTYPPSEAMGDSDYALIKAEMEQYIGMPYVWAGDRPETSFDCSGLTAWVYGRALGISLPHSAQGQYDMAIPVAPEEAKPGDLVFFHSTYETDKYITHVGIYAGEGIMFEAGGGGIKYTDFTTDYWIKHFVGFGRVNATPD